MAWRGSGTFFILNFLFLSQSKPRPSPTRLVSKPIHSQSNAFIHLRQTNRSRHTTATQPTPTTTTTHPTSTLHRAHPQPTTSRQPHPIFIRHSTQQPPMGHIHLQSIMDQHSICPTTSTTHRRRHRRRQCCHHAQPRRHETLHARARTHKRRQTRISPPRSLQKT
jgi:hypothetical protein